MSDDEDGRPEIEMLCRDAEIDLTVVRHSITGKFEQWEIVEECDGGTLTLNVSCDEGEYECELTVTFPEGGVWSDAKIEFNGYDDGFMVYDTLFGLDEDNEEEKPLLIEIERFVENAITRALVEALRQPWDE